MQQWRTGVTGIVLGGGHGTRLHTAKPMIQLGGKLVLARIADVLHQLCDEIIFVARQDQEDQAPDTAIALRMHVVTDTQPYRGPLAALHAGLEATATPLAFVTGGDHPFLSRPLIQAMLQAARRQPDRMESVFALIEGSLQPLHSVMVVTDWVDTARAALDRGERSPLGMIQAAARQDTHAISVMTADEAAIHDTRLLSFFDLDTPEDLNIARRLLDPRRVNLRPDIRRGGL